MKNFYCKQCGESDIIHDATARYDPETDKYEVVDVLDGSYCVSCEETVKVVFGEEAEQ